ncbi:hypothetical protein [Nocardioides sp. LML1-1-1.1]|uniref:hypothetical protein n=1 Tax=Nocardioides sp. LML1-1-1.1 TaxID=3135248 RepID=UPI00344AD10B
MHLTSLRRVGLTILALLASTLSLVAVTSAPAHAADITTVAHLQRNYSLVRHGSAVTFQGYVTQAGSTTPRQPGATYLQRRIVGQTAWATLPPMRDLATDATPTWTTVPNYSADYRLYFAGFTSGDLVVKPSVSATVRVNVRRNLHDNFRRATRVFYGKVTPSYARRVVTIQKSTCASPTSASCRWVTYKGIRTTSTSGFSVKLPVYARRTHFRAVVKPSNGYYTSFSNNYVTTYRY